MIHIRIAPEYQTNKEISEFVGKIPLTFDDEGSLLYDKRNTIKSFKVTNQDIPCQLLVVKRFKTPNIIQRIAYSFFRSSKAVRAFDNAAELRRRGINTPHEVACIEEKHGCLLRAAYVITHFTGGQPIGELLLTPEGVNPAAAKNFVHFVIELHSKGILHHDLNSTNVLYHKTEEGGYFSVIDINRMKFKSPGELTPAECFENLTRFTGQMDLFDFVLKYYIKERGWADEMIHEARKIKINHDRQRVRRKVFFNHIKKIRHV